MDPVDEEGDEGGQDDEAEAVRARLSCGCQSAPEEADPEDAQQPEGAAEEEAADRSVDQRERHQTPRSHVDLGIQEVEEVGHVQPEDGPGQHSFPVTPSHRHDRADSLARARGRC